jgi:glycosyltransferase involved in cell wall biosynthesis
LLRRSGYLCQGPEVKACINCLASTEAAAYLAIRAVRMKRFFAAVDHFIAPSYFLKQQYQAWGISAKKLSVIENLPPTQKQFSHEPEAYSTIRLGYFGQVNQWKGLNLILEAVARALGEGASICLQVHGIDADGISEGVEQANPFHLNCAHWLGQIKAGAVQLRGSYHETELTERLLGVDVLVMGSIWYENSPMVIQEAFCHGLPVLAPKLGGMAEKINHNKNGLLYEAANISALASLFVQLTADPKLVAKLKANARKAGLGLHRAATQHEHFYASCLFNNK